VTSSVLAAVALVGVAGPAAGQGLQPAGGDEIMAAARSCAAATNATGVDPRKLEADGWNKATVSSNGKPVTTPLTMYGKGHLLLMFDAAGASPLCIVTGRIPSVAEFPKLQAAFAAAYGTPIKDDGKGEQMFIAPDHRVVDLASTGSSDHPAVRVGVGPVFQETK
jgi:hypothetical protein